MNQFIQPNYNVIRYEIDVIKTITLLPSTYQSLTIFYKLHNKYSNLYQLPQLFTWYESLTPKQLKDINLNIVTYEEMIDRKAIIKSLLKWTYSDLRSVLLEKRCEKNSMIFTYKNYHVNRIRVYN